MAKREFLMLAHTFDPAKHNVVGWYASEKLDGQRCYWDGGITRGMLKSDVPWANTNKDSRYQTPPIATGLWSRYGNVIHAPDWWLNQLPLIPLDGELWLGRGEGTRQELSKIIKTLEPGPRWSDVRFKVFDSPAYGNMFTTGEIKNPNFTKMISESKIMEFLGNRNHIPLHWRFEEILQFLETQLRDNPVATFHNQIKVCSNDHLYGMLEAVTENAGEGIIVKAPTALWWPERSHKMLKLKKLQDAEAKVLGYVSGRKTDLGSKLLGKMGALVVEFQGKAFELSGFTDEERKFDCYQSEVWAAQHPGLEVPEWIMCPAFPRGSIVTFRYRELTADGIPSEARYWRRRHVAVS